MEKDKALNKTHGITLQLRVRLSKLPTTTTAAERLQDKINPQLKLNSNFKLGSRNSRKPSCKTTHGRTVYKCPICPSHVELSSTCLRNHIAASHKSEKLSKCPFSTCNFSTWVPHFLRYHLARVHQQLPFHCSVCPRKFKSFPTLQVHVLSHASAELKQFKCPRFNCNFSTHYVTNLAAHSKTHDLELKYKCSQCGWRTKHKNNIAKHVKRIHDNTIREKLFKCPQSECNFTADCLGNIKSHSRFHLDHKPFKCHLCKFSTKYKNNLKTHLGVHSEVKPFQCNLCGRKIRALSALHDHVRRHLGENPFKCPESECVFVAATRSDMKMHVYRRHSKETGTELKSYKCPLCENTFKAKRYLTSHCRTHTLEKPFSCIFCSRGFGTNGSKKCHEGRCKMRPQGP